jgi:hypothetical protein
MELDDIAQARMDSLEIGEPGLLVDLDAAIVAPAAEAGDYRHRFERTRRGLVRRRLQDLIAEIDELLSALAVPPDDRDLLPGWAEEFTWDELREMVAETRRLLKGQFPSGPLLRHLSFAEPVDLRDIVIRDWPTVRTTIARQLYLEREPLPVDVEDLATLAASGPAGVVTTALNWPALDDEAFERLIFNLIGDTTGYENAKWLTRTNAPDRGRDLSVDRVLNDELAGTRRLRVLIQCRHWTSKSVTPTRASEAVTKAELWTDPRFDVVVIATTGRFTSDAVAWI